MPIYVYHCRLCGHSFELQQNFFDPPITRCPNCEAKLHKEIKLVTFIFKEKNNAR